MARLSISTILAGSTVYANNFFELLFFALVSINYETQVGIRCINRGILFDLLCIRGDRFFQKKNAQEMLTRVHFNDSVLLQIMIT